MAENSNRDASGTVPEAKAGGATRAACAAGELKDLLQRIAGHIADADQRHDTVLRDMHQRLLHLGEDAQAVRDTVPAALSAAFSRIEEGLARLAERVGEGTDIANRPANVIETPVAPPSATNLTRQAHLGSTGSWSWESAEASTHSSPALQSAMAPANYHDRVQGGQIASVPVDVSAAIGETTDGLSAAEAEWDPASAEALTQAYEEVDHENPGAAAAGAPVGHFNPRSAITPDPPQLGEANDNGWLEQRFAQIAARLEESLAAMRSDNSLPALEERFQVFEQRVSSALEEVATRTDVAGLRLIEAHIAELTQHIDHAQAQLARLDALEANLAHVAEHVSEERLAKLAGKPELTEEDITKLAAAVADRVSERSRAPEDAEAGRQVATTLDELRGLIERLSSAQREADEQTAGALTTVQQAVVHLLDRIDALEQSRPSWHSDALDDSGPDAASTDRSDDEQALARVYRHQARPAAQAAAGAATVATPAVAMSESQTDPATTLDQIAVGIEQARNAARAAQMSEPRSTAEHGAPDGRRSDASPASREQFIAAARRAARQASGPQQEEMTAARMASAARGRARLGEPVSILSRPGLLVAALVVVLIVGAGLTTYSLFKGGKSAATERSLLLLRDDEPRAFSQRDDEGRHGGDAPGLSPTSEDRAAAAAATEVEARDVTIIGDDEQAARRRQILDGRAVAPATAGIMLDTASIGSPEEIARARQQRTMAQLSTKLGAAQSGVQSIPAALIPTAPDQSAGGTPEPSRASQPLTLPPAAVGPLSLRMAAANGDPSAEFEVAARLAEGRGIQQDFKQAAVWYQRAAARGFAPAQYRLGTLYERGLGVKADLGRAKAWYKSAAEKGNVKAMHNLAVLDASGSSADFTSAARWFAEAAERGVRDSQFNLGVLFENGVGVSQDLKAAYKWFALAAQAGDKEALRRRDSLKTRLEASELAAAEALVRNWKAKPVDALVNDARAAGETWKLRDTGIPPG
jgi:localization factor PodJL